MNFGAQASIGARGSIFSMGKSRGQGAIEYLLIIGAGILVVAIVIIAITSVLNQGQTNNSSGVTTQDSAYDSLKELSYFKVSGYYYPKESLLVTSLNNSWRFDDGAGATTFSNSVPSNATASCVPNVSCPTYVSTGAFTGAYSFDKSAQEKFISINRGSFDDLPKQETYSVWFKPDSSNTQSINGILSFIIYLNPVEHGDDPSYTTHVRNRVFLNSSNKVAVSVGSYGGGCDEAWVDLVSTNSVNLNNWNQVVVTIDYNLLKTNLYLNGVFQSPGGQLTLGSTQCKNNLITCVCNNDNLLAWVGRRKFYGTTYENNFSGLIDEVTIWNNILSATDVNQLYQNALAK